MLVLLQPGSTRYRQQLEETQRRISEAVAERTKAGEKARQAGDLDGATTQYLRVLSVDPQNAAAAQALRELEDERVRRAYFTRPPRTATAARPAAGRNGAGTAGRSDDVADLELGVTLFKQGNYAGSAQTLEKYLQKHPKDDVARGYLADAYHQLGLASLVQGRKEEALGYLEKCERAGYSDPAELSNTIRSVRRALGDEYYRLGMQAFASDLTKAISLWERSLYFDPGNTQASLRLEQARRAQRTMQSIDQGEKKSQ